MVLARFTVLNELALRGEPILASLAAACAVSRDCRIIDVIVIVMRAGRRAASMAVELMERQTAITSATRYFFLLPCAGSRSVAAMVVTMVAISSSVSFSNVRW